MVVLEAMAAGVPVAAANVGGVPDLVQDGVTGILFEPQDGAAMRRAIAGLLQEEGAGPLAQKAVQIAYARYHPEVIARQHLDIYRTLL